MRENGIVKKKIIDKGIGFITTENVDEDIFFHRNVLEDVTLDELREGAPVSFERAQSSKGTIAEEVSQIHVLKPEAELPADTESSQVEHIAIVLIDGKLKVVSLKSDGSYRFLDEGQQLNKNLYVVSSETMALKIAVDELEYLVNDPNSKERDFQDFFDRHRNFIINDEYKDAHSHVRLTKDEGDTLIPDFVLEPFYQNSMCDLLELKLPSAKVFVLKKNRMRFSSAIYEALAQLQEYGNYFDEEKNRKKIEEDYGLSVFKPKMFLIIGRQAKIDPLVKRSIESNVPDLNLRTYDEIIIRQKAKVEAMKKARM